MARPLFLNQSNSQDQSHPGRNQSRRFETHISRCRWLVRTWDLFTCITGYWSQIDGGDGCNLGFCVTPDSGKQGYCGRCLCKYHSTTVGTSGGDEVRRQPDVAPEWARQECGSTLYLPPDTCSRLMCRETGAGSWLVLPRAPAERLFDRRRHPRNINHYYYPLPSRVDLPYAVEQGSGSGWGDPPCCTIQCDWRTCKWCAWR